MSAALRPFRALLCALLLAAALPAAALAADTIVVVARHGEKVPDGSKDPELTEAGRARAQALAATLRDTPPAAVYSTPLRRTRETARPAAEAAGVPVTERAPDAAALAAHIRAEHAGQVVLVVGHSNTVPDLVQALSGRAVPPIADDEYDRYYVVVLSETPRVFSARYGAPAAGAQPAPAASQAAPHAH